MQEENPYLGEKGVPLFGMLVEATNWARKAELKRRKQLSLEEQEELRKADEHLARKMNS